MATQGDNCLPAWFEDDEAKVFNLSTDAYTAGNSDCAMCGFAVFGGSCIGYIVEIAGFTVFHSFLPYSHFLSVFILISRRIRIFAFSKEFVMVRKKVFSSSSECARACVSARTCTKIALES